MGTGLSVGITLSAEATTGCSGNHTMLALISSTPGAAQYVRKAEQQLKWLINLVELVDKHVVKRKTLRIETKLDTISCFVINCD